MQAEEAAAAAASLAAATRAPLAGLEAELERLQRTQAALLERVRAHRLADEHAPAVASAADALSEVPVYEARLARVLHDMDALAAQAARLRARAAPPPADGGPSR